MILENKCKENHRDKMSGVKGLKSENWKEWLIDY